MLVRAKKKKKVNRGFHVQLAVFYITSVVNCLVSS